MTLLENLKENLKEALRAKDGGKKDAIRQIMSEFPKLTVPITLESGKKSSRPKRPEEIEDDDIFGIIRGLVKSEKTVLELKKEESSTYLTILEAYLPGKVSPEEVEAWIRDNINFSEFKNVMQAMGPIMKHFGQRVDGNTVKAILQEMAGK